MDVLVCLAGHAGEALPKEKLLQTVWPDTFVSEDVLKRCISELRRVFEDDAREPRIIETIPKRGYRLVASVEPVNGTKAAPLPAPLLPASFEIVDHPTSSKRVWWAGAIAIAAAVIIAILFIITLRIITLRTGRPAHANVVPVIHSLAVLPLQNLSADPNQEYFADGMTDALITDLAQISSLKVISRTSIVRYKKTEKSLAEIAREINVDGVVEGTVQRSGDRVRITAQLIQAPSDNHLWANSYERDVRDLFALEEQVAGDLANQVRARIMPPNAIPSAEPRPVNEQALEAYLQGDLHLRLSLARRDEELRKAGKYFQQAIDADPTFVPAYLGLSQAHHLLFWPSIDDFAIFQGSAAKALELAPNSSDAHQAVGDTQFEDWDWASAEQEERRAIALNPNSAWAHDELGRVLEVIGQKDESWKEYQAAQVLDPNQDHLSWALFHRGEYDRAIALAERTAERDPEDASILWQLSESHARKGLYAESLREWSKSVTVAGFPDAGERVLRAFARSGYQSALRQEAKETERAIAGKQGYFPGILADIYGTLGDKDQAFYWLQQGCEHRHLAISDPLLAWVKIDPGFASLRSDPRFRDVLHCMGLAP